MRAIVINPFDQTVTEVQTDGSLNDIYAHTDCRCIDVVRVSNNRRDALYLDDEGLYRPDQRFYMYEGYPNPLAGKGIILGTTNSGDNASCSLTVNEVISRVSWLSPNVKFHSIETTETKTKHPLFGDQPVDTIVNTPVFVIEEEDKKEE